MKIQLNIEADTTAEILEAVKELAATGVITTQVKPAEAKMREVFKELAATGIVTTQAKPVDTKKQSAKPAKQKEPEAVDVPSETVVEDTPSVEDKTEPVQEMPAQEASADNASIPSVVELRAAAQEKGGNTPEGRKLVKSLLNQFESKSISDLPAEKRAAFLAALEES